MTGALCPCGDEQPLGGLQVGRKCANLVDRALTAAPSLYSDLAAPLRATQGSGGRTDPATRPGPITPERVEARIGIRVALVGWCRVLEEERSIGLPVESIPGELDAITAHLKRHAGTLLAMDGPAEGLVSDCRDILALERVAWPARWTGVRVTCPSCSAPVSVDTSAEIVRCRTPECPEYGVPSWWIERLLPETGRLMTALEAAEWLGRTIPWLSVQAGTLTKWAQRGHLAAASYGGQGVESLFDPVVVVRTALVMRDRRVA